MSESTRQMLTENLENVRQSLAELFERIDSVDDPDEFGQPFEELNEYPLEIVWEVGEPFAVVLGTGGPHIEITGGGRQGAYTLHGYWGGEHVALSGAPITRTGEYFRNFYDECY